MPHLVKELLQRGVGFRLLQDGYIDTTTATGKFMFHVFSSLAQFERWLIHERSTAGLTGAGARGRLGVRRQITGSDPRVQDVKRLNQDRSLGIDEICKTLGISRWTFCRYLALPDTSNDCGPVLRSTPLEQR